MQHKQQLSWLALRAARDQYLHLYGKIGTGDVELLVQAIENEKTEAQETIPVKEKGEESPASPMAGVDGQALKTEAEANGSEPAGDVNMEEAKETASEPVSAVEEDGKAEDMKVEEPVTAEPIASV
jgi:THO complex subunit 1